MNTKADLKLAKDLLMGLVRATPVDNPKDVLLKRLRLATRPKITGKTAASKLGLSYRQYIRYESGITTIPDRVYLMIRLGAWTTTQDPEEVKRWLERSLKKRD